MYLRTVLTSEVVGGTRKII